MLLLVLALNGFVPSQNYKDPRTEEQKRPVLLQTVGSALPLSCFRNLSKGERWLLAGGNLEQDPTTVIKGP